MTSPVDIGEIVERLKANIARQNAERPGRATVVVDLEDLRALLTDRDDLVRKLGVARDTMRETAERLSIEAQLNSSGKDRILRAKMGHCAGDLFAALKVLDGRDD